MTNRRWEYKVIDLEYLENEADEIRLNTFGDQMWELVAVQPLSGGANRLIFKREA